MAQRSKKRTILTITTFSCVIVFLFLSRVGTAHAQSLFSPFSSALPLGALESVIGPIIPEGGIWSTFRSEVTAGYHGASVEAARLSGPIERDLDLRFEAPFDEYPARFTLNANVRLWRFGLRAGYSHFQTLGQVPDVGFFDFSGLNLGLDVDVVQFKWFSLGVGADHYFYEPRLRTQGVDRIDLINLDGTRPSTAGPYMRYMPPEILGFPLHVEAFYKVPLTGSQLTTYGLGFVFRPQIFRFDLGCRIGIERMHLSIEDDPDDILHFFPPHDDWRVDMEWHFWGAELLIYF